MSTPKLTPVEELRDVLALTVRCLGEPYLRARAPTLWKRIADVLKKTEGVTE